MKQYALAIAAALLGAIALPAASIPRPASDMNIQTAGGPIKVSNYKGKVVLVEIMSTTCPHCQNSARVISKLNSEFGAKGFQPLGVAINDNPQVANFIKTYGVNFPVGTGSRDESYSFLQHSVMAPFYFPQVVFIDRTGTVRAQYSGTDAFLTTNEEANMRALIQKLLAEGSAAGSSSSKKAPAAGKQKKAS